MSASESPDELLVVAAILGNLEAFEELVVRYRPAVVRLARTDRRCRLRRRCRAGLVTACFQGAARYRRAAQICGMVVGDNTSSSAAVQ